ncbi:conserved exported hypothetical protein [uncultured Desulfatiglans sp.]|nr:conserved exported hypothetical protein [uncultured Desulfatiglans sp.]
MKKAGMVLGVLLLVGALAYPVFAWGPGRGGFGSGFGDGYGPCRDGGAAAANLTDDQRVQLDELHQRFYNETNEIRNQMWTKQRELSTVMNADTPDLEKAKGLQRELNGLKGQMAEKRLEYDIEARKIAPEAGNFRAGKGYGKGLRGGKGGYGRCWN